MPTTVREAFAAAGLVRAGVVKWGTRPATSAPGVNVIALTDSVDSLSAATPSPRLAASAFAQWLTTCPGLTVDGARGEAPDLMNRVRGFWSPDEVILYIGLAGTSLSTRLKQYYTTPIGAPRPHSGGYFLKLLANLSDLWVHFAPCADTGRAEDEMLRRFCENVSAASRSQLRDPAHPFPFANLAWPPGTNKDHGLKGVRSG